MTTESITPLVIDTSGLHCPMPLLKLKMALRNHTDGTPIRLISTDPMSQQDIKRYCEIAGLRCEQQDNNIEKHHFIFNIIQN
ncbi:MAG: sulfurtransferase TusA family protein [Gammaproteobacteria bacterium]|nr:sulfurtransferase TusA family protein [Gammaproteobacteria bacterium]